MLFWKRSLFLEIDHPVCRKEGHFLEDDWQSQMGEERY